MSSLQPIAFQHLFGGGFFLDDEFSQTGLQKSKKKIEKEKHHM